MTQEEINGIIISQCGIRTFHETDVYKMFNTHLIIVKQIQTKLEQRIKELEHTIKQDNNLITSELHKIEELQSTIEAQEIIIKDMAQHTSCEGCEWSFSGMNSKCEGCRQTTVVKLSNYQAKAQP